MTEQNEDGNKLQKFGSQRLQVKNDEGAAFAKQHLHTSYGERGILCWNIIIGYWFKLVELKETNTHLKFLPRLPKCKHPVFRIGSIVSLSVVYFFPSSGFLLLKFLSV